MTKLLDKVEADVARLQKDITVMHSRQKRFAVKNKSRLDEVSKVLSTMKKRKK